MEQQPQDFDPHQNDFSRFYHEYIKPFWETYGTQVLMVVLVASSLFAFFQWRGYLRSEGDESAWSSYAGASSPESYYNVAQTYRNSRPAAAAMAWLDGADLYLQQARTGDDMALDDDAAPVSDEAREDALNSAAAGYNSVRQLATVDAVYHFNALLGLAAVAESRQEWDKAGELYEQVAEQAKKTFPLLARRAEARLALLPRLPLPVAFAEDVPDFGGFSPDPTTEFPFYQPFQSEPGGSMPGESGEAPSLPPLEWLPSPENGDAATDQPMIEFPDATDEPAAPAPMAE